MYHALYNMHSHLSDSPCPLSILPRLSLASPPRSTLPHSTMPAPSDQLRLSLAIFYSALCSRSLLPIDLSKKTECETSTARRFRHRNGSIVMVAVVVLSRAGLALRNKIAHRTFVNLYPLLPQQIWRFASILSPSCFSVPPPQSSTSGNIGVSSLALKAFSIASLLLVFLALESTRESASSTSVEGTLPDKTLKTRRVYSILSDVSARIE